MSDASLARRATLIGGTAVLMWGTLALLTVWSGAVPPFQLIAMCFAIAFVADNFLTIVHRVRSHAPHWNGRKRINDMMCTATILLNGCSEYVLAIDLQPGHSPRAAEQLPGSFC